MVSGLSPSLIDVLAADPVCLSVAAQVGLMSLANLGKSCPLLARQPELQPLNSTAPDFWDSMTTDGLLCGALAKANVDQKQLHEQILASARQCPDILTRATPGRFRECVDTEGTEVQPLHLAASRGLLQTCQLLLALGADFHAVDAKGQTPLMKAILHGHENTTLLLLKAGAGAGIDAADWLRRTALHFACMSGLAKAVDALVTHGATIEARDALGWTPLMHAVSARREAGFEAAARLLLAQADPAAVDKRGRSVMQLARESRNKKILSLLEMSMANQTGM